MYVNKSNKNRYDVISFIEGQDIYNSKLLKSYKDFDFSNTGYLCFLTKADKRSDIISNRLLGSSKYESFLYLMNHDLDLTKDYIELDSDIDTLLKVLGV